MNERDLHARACSLFLELRGQDAPSRERVLTALEHPAGGEGDDARRLAQEVRSLLRYDGAPDDAAPRAAGPTMPSNLGPYRIVERIGRGGSGHVFLAEQTEPVQRMVAIKVVPEAAIDPDLAARFEVERRALERTVHPNIVRLIDAGRTLEGLPYLVMDFVDGEPITTHCVRKGLTLDQRVHLVMAVADGVQHAHHRGVVHRDLKPANVVVTEIGGRAVPIVLDFGIAKPLAGLFHATAATSGFPAGTPAYMAPEQAGFGEVDARVDVYALGALLYELIAGQTPIPLADDLATTFARLRDFVPPPPSRLRAAAARHETATSTALLRDLDAIALRALEKAPERRYATVAALRADLARALAAEPIEARNATWRYQLGCFVRRQRRLASSLLVLALAIVVAFVSLTWDLFAVERERQQAQAERNAQEELNRFLTDDVFAAAAPDRLGPDTPAITLLHRISGAVDERFVDRPKIAAVIHRSLGEVFSRVEDFDRAQFHLDRALTLHRHDTGATAATLTAEIAAASLLVRRQRFEDAEQVYTTLLPRARATLVADDPAMFSLLNDLGVTLSYLGREKEAVPLLEEALAGRARLFGDTDSLTFVTHSNLALATGEIGPPQRSLEMLEAALARATSLSDPPRYVLFGLHNNIGATLLDLGRGQHARPHLALALELVRGLFDEDHAATLQVRGNLASLDADLGRTDQAFVEYQDIIERLTRTLGPTAEVALVARHGMWSCARKAGRFADAAIGFAQLLDDVIAALSEQHPLVPQTQYALANALAKAQRPAEALPHARAAATNFLARYPADHPRTKTATALVRELEAK